MGAAEARLDGAIAYRSLVRYDAYGELTGNQSTTIALLDAERNGVVLSSIVRRDTARIYCKQVVDGRGELELSPEEAEAVRRALAGESAAHAAGMRVGFLGPAGTYSEEAVLAGDGAADLEPVPLPTSTTRWPPSATGASSARWCRSRTRSRAPSTPRSTRSRTRPAASRSPASSSTRSTTA